MAKQFIFGEIGGFQHLHLIWSNLLFVFSVNILELRTLLMETKNGEIFL